MTAVNVVMCAGFSPSARMVRKALRRVADKKDVVIITPCPAGAGLNKFIDEIKTLDPSRTMVVDGCEGCCGMQALMAAGIVPAKMVVMDKVVVIDDKAVTLAEEQILASLKEMGA